MQRLADGQLLEDTGFDRYNHLLLSLDNQLGRLHRYNHLYWNDRLTPEQLFAVDTSCDVAQQVDDLTHFHVQFDSDEETVEMWWRVYVGEQPNSWRSRDLKLDTDHFRLWASNVRRYEPGIHRVRTNLVAHWEPETGRTLTEVRDRVKSNGETAAPLETMSAYGLHSELFREQNGETLPYSDLAGTEYRIEVPDDAPEDKADEAWPGALYVHWSPLSYSARLGAGLVDIHRDGWAAPVLRES